MSSLFVNSFSDRESKCRPVKESVLAFLINIGKPISSNHLNVSSIFQSATFYVKN